MADDAQLLRQYIETRSETAFAELVDRHLGLVYHSAIRQLGGDSHGARDVAQSVFLLLSHKARALVRHPSLAGWLHTTTHYKVAEILRAERRRRLREEAAQAMQEILTESSPPDDWERIRPVLDEAMFELGERDREAVLLRFFENRPFSEIGERLSLTEKTAHKRVERALDKLRDRLSRRGITSSAAALATMLGAQNVLATPTGLAAAVTGAATAGPGLAAAFTLIQLMSSTKAIVAAAVVIVGLTGSIAMHEINVSRGAAIALTMAEHRRNDLLAQVRTAQVAADQAERDRAALEKNVARRRAAQTAAANPAEFPIFTGLPGLQDGTNFLNAHPEVRQAFVENFRTTLTAEYGELFAALGLSPAQIERFQDIEMNALGSILGQYLVELGEPMSTYKEHTDQLRELLGETGLQKYNDFRKTEPARTLVTQLASAVYFTDTPLTATQAGQLKQIIKTAPARPEEYGLARVPWDDVLPQAQSILSPAQFAAMQDMHQIVLHDLALSKALRLISRN